MGDPDDVDAQGLHRLGAVAALVVLALVPVQVAVFLATPPPTTVDGWLALFADQPLLALVHMDGLLVVDQVLTAVVFLALAVALRRTRPSMLALALLFEVLAVASYVASNGALAMLALSGAWTRAATDAERATIVAAGRAIVATSVGTGFGVGYVLGGLALVSLAVPLFRDARFGRGLAALTAVMGALMLVPPTVGTFGLVLSLVSLVPLLPWLAMVARRLWTLGPEPMPASPPRGAPR